MSEQNHSSGEESDSSDSEKYGQSKEKYDYNKIEDIGILKGSYKLDNDEEELFEGDYKSKYIKNKALGTIELDEMEWNISCQIIYKKGRVMYKSDIENENIFDLIDLFIKYTYDPCSNLDLNKTFVENTQMRFGTICPTRKRLFVYKDREFTAYGRYIFGYDKRYVKIQNETRTIKLRNPPWDGDCDEYVYAFLIRNHTTKIVEAFGLYR